MMWTLHISYINEHIEEYDLEICKLMKKKDYGSGYRYGERDMYFSFRNSKDAVAAVNRCAKAIKNKNIVISNLELIPDLAVL